MNEKCQYRKYQDYCQCIICIESGTDNVLTLCWTTGRDSPILGNNRSEATKGVLWRVTVTTNFVR